MLVVAIDFNKEDNPDLRYPYLVDTAKLPQKLATIIETAKPNDRGYAEINMNVDDYDEYTHIVHTEGKEILAPVEGRIEKIVEIWY